MCRSSSLRSARLGFYHPQSRTIFNFKNFLFPDWIDYFRKLREEYDKLEGALKKLGVDPECVVTEEEDGYNAESDLEEDTEQDCEREVATFVPAVYTVDPGHRRPGPLARVDEVGFRPQCCSNNLENGNL